MINNFMCSNCDKVAVCKVYDTLAKFDVEAKKPLGVDITMNKCINYSADSEEKDD